MRKIQHYCVPVWFLDKDPHKTVSWLDNKHLMSSISGAYEAVMDAYMYCIGIRNYRYYKYYFDPQRKSDTMDQKFNNWPLKIPPKINNTRSIISKWARQCREHIDYLISYLIEAFDQYQSRFSRDHGLSRFVDWFQIDSIPMKLPSINGKEISFPWKILNPKFRKKDILAGYRRMYISQFYGREALFSCYEKSKVDVPDFIIKFYQFDIEQ